MTRIWPLATRQTRINLDIYADCAHFGGWQPIAKTFEPLHFIDAVAAFGAGTQTQYALDCITLAVEAGAFATRAELKAAVFASAADFDAFCTALANYDWWLNERHFYAFAVLLDAEEFTLRTYAELAAEFRETYAAYPAAPATSA
ncbi:MAG: hypothetical protein VB032_06595 [Burkholderiaceae bacterium]|nr:hypothetical protein [Burkholderiaceae bacterium]